MANFEYLIIDPASRECVVVDPAWDVKGLIALAGRRDLTIKGAPPTRSYIVHPTCSDLINDVSSQHSCSIGSNVLLIIDVQTERDQLPNL